MQKQNNIPQLRFPEFKGEWEIKKVGELCDSIVPGRNKPTNFDGDIPWITTPDIEHNGTIMFSKIGLNISKEEAKKVGSKIVPKNSIVISCVGDLGLAAIAGKEIVINQQLHAFIPKENVEYRFLLYQLSLQKRYMDRVATKTAVPYMNKENCNSIPVSFPTLPEQKRIASFFTVLDKKISELKQKKNLLEQYKKGVMQKLFLNYDENENHENYDEANEIKSKSIKAHQKNHSSRLRFKDDKGKDFPKWEKKKLGDCLDYIQPTNYLVANTEYNDSYKTPVLTAGKTFILGYTNETNGIFENNLPVIIFDDFTTATQFVDFAFKAKSSAMKILIAKENANIKFMYEAMKIMKYEIGGHERHWISKFAHIEIDVPSFEEQTKIANFLSALDEKINRTENQIQQTEQYKKGLLQNMFC